MINIKKELTSMAEIISDKKPSSAANTNARTANIADKGVPISEPNQKLLNELITQIKIFRCVHLLWISYWVLIFFII